MFVRETSSYYEHLVQLNTAFKEAGNPEITLTLADEFLEDEDLLEMLNAGLIPIIVVDKHKAEFGPRFTRSPYTLTLRFIRAKSPGP